MLFQLIIKKHNALHASNDNFASKIKSDLQNLKSPIQENNVFLTFISLIQAFCFVDFFFNNLNAFNI